MKIKYNNEDYDCQLMFWDVGGQEKFNNVRHMFYKGTNGSIVVYDTTRPITFLKVPDFLQDLETTLRAKVPFIVLGNKIDLKDMRRVERENGEKLVASSNAIAFFETSAKTGINVSELFHYAAAESRRLRHATG